MSQPGSPRCRMCALPAWWLPKTQSWSQYCWSTACRNRERLCQRCGEPFAVGGPHGGGTKYCSRECKFTGYRPDLPVERCGLCAWCGRDPAGRIRPGGKWPFICADCLYPIRHVVPRLKDHNVSHELARRLLTNPGCEICRTDMLTPRRQSNSKVSATLVVDHDHACCPVEKSSCGRCVRGLICRNCNAAAGQLRDSADAARSLAAYLDRWQGGSGRG